MLNFLWWLITVEAIGLAAFPLSYYLLRRLPDRGFSFSKPLGILVLGYAGWILSVLHLVPSVRLSLIAMLLLMAAVSVAIVVKKRDELAAFIRAERRTLILAEAIFLVFLVGWALFRAYDPAIDHTEQPMDFAFLNASIESSTGQPEDPWLRGEPISYYYFGYWMMGGVSELSGVPSNFSYNLSLALIPAMAAMGVFGLVVAMVRSERARWGYAVAGGIAAGIVLGVAGNLEGVLEFMRANAIGGQGFYDWIRIDGLSGPVESPSDSWVPQDFWWWFRATRVINTFQEGQGIDYTIQEFPFFSFMLGDLHPHVSAIPFALLFAGFAWNFFNLRESELSGRSLYTYALVGAMALSLGGLAFTNLWDAPTSSALLVGVVALRSFRLGRQDVSPPGWLTPDRVPASRVRSGVAKVLFTLRAGLFPVLVIGLAFILFLPYYLSFASSVEGIGAVTTPTRYPHLLLVWGVPLVLVGPFIVAAFWETRVRPGWRRTALYALAVGFLPYVAWLVLRLQTVGGSESPVGRLVHVFPLAVLISMSVWSAISLARERRSNARAFALLLSTLGLLLIMGPELFYVDDFFGPPSERMNTVFKLYHQAWVLLAAASGFAIYYWLSTRDVIVGWKLTMSTLWAAGAAMLLMASMYYPAAAAASKSNFFNGDPTLDGLEFVRTNRGAEYAAIEYVKASIAPGAGILEAVGEWSDAGLISRSTGVSTVFNWPGHQLQWRGSGAPFDGRERDIARIYETVDPQEARILLSKYDVEYVYVGPRERSKHGGQALENFEDLLETVFRQDDVAIYRVRN
jgi:YYY domain-containing protein